jgi:hypothetical protein
VANITAYEASRLDWSALSSLAQRAAQETPLTPAPRFTYFNRATRTHVELLGPHWILDHRMQNSQATEPAFIDEDHTDVVYALLPDGELVYVQVIEETRIYLPTEYSLGRNAPPTYKDRHTLRKMSDSDVEVFDFAKDYYESGRPDDRVWGDSLGRGSLVHDFKGAGLSRLLEDVRAGRQANLPGPLSKYNNAAPPKPVMGPSYPPRAGQTYGASGYRSGTTRRRLIVFAGILALVVAAIVLFNRHDKAKQTAHSPITNPITTERQIVEHPTLPLEAVKDVIRSMGIGSCWNGRWSWSAADDSYMPLSVPAVVDCSSAEATQTLDMVSDNCRGSTAQMNLTRRIMFDGQAYCLLLVPSEGMCLPSVLSGGSGNYTGLPVVCDTPPSPRFPSLMHLSSRLANDNSSCNTDAGYYYIWFDAANRGFCYTIIT